jgi:hypothetical protein
MNAAIKLNPSFSSAFADRGTAAYDRRDFDRGVVADGTPLDRPAYAMNATGRNASYENRREGDRIVQDLNAPIRNTQYNAYAYSPETFAPVAQAAAEPPRPPVPEPPATVAPPALRSAAPAQPKPEAKSDMKRTVPMPQSRPERSAKDRTMTMSKPKVSARPIVLPPRAALSRAAAWPPRPARPLQQQRR